MLELVVPDLKAADTTAPDTSAPSANEDCTPLVPLSVSTVKVTCESSSLIRNGFANAVNPAGTPAEK